MEATSAPRPHALRIPKPRRLLAALPDERLVEHVRKGEPAAFEVLYDRHSAGILGFCRHMLRSSADAEDAVQHTFMAAHADIERHGERNLHVKAWLYTIARNRCLSMLRARREQPSDDALEIVSDRMLDDIEQREELRALLGDVSKLPDDQREALVLAEVGDLSHSDISAILGCEVSKVKSLVFQARTALVDRRVARETPCEEIREQIATLRGGALRRSHLRHHIEACPGCAEYREQIRRQRAMLAVALPVVPSAALKANVLGSIGLGGTGTAAAASGGGAAVGTATAGTATATTGAAGLLAQGGLAAKLGIVAVLAAGGAGGATVANHGAVPLLQDSNAAHSSSSSKTDARSLPAAATPVTTAAQRAGTSTAAARKHTSTGSHRSAKGTQNGFTPTTGQSNGAAARAFAKTRKQHNGTGKRHATAHKRARPAKPVHEKHVAVPRRPAKPVTKAPAPKAAPAPKSEATPKTEVTPTTTTTAPTTTQPQPTPTTTPGSSGDGSTGGKLLGTGKRTTTG